MRIGGFLFRLPFVARISVLVGFDSTPRILLSVSDSDLDDQSSGY